MSKPIVASYCTTFLKPEMLHIYRQVTGLQRYETFVIAEERKCEDRFPFEQIELLPKPPLRLVKHFVEKYIHKMPALRYRGYMDVLSDLLNRRPADLMHVYFGHTGVHLLPFLQAWNRPAIVSFHGADVMLREDRPRYARLMRQMLEQVPLVLARSTSLTKRLEAIGCPPEKIRLNRTGIPLNDYPLAQRPMPADGEWRFVQACRLIPKKGLRCALEAFARFHRQFPKATFTIAGEGPMKGELETLAGELGISGAIHFPGFLAQPDLAGLYRCSHVFLHPSEVTQDQNQEGIPNSMLEAMATGLPVVATLHGGIPEAVQDEATGFLVPERNTEALAAALRRITEAPERLQIMGRRASESVRAEFEQKQSIRKLEACYDEALALDRPGP
ncbi:MAG: glycosyltransferase [Verrucomicrobiota bacterium]